MRSDGSSMLDRIGRKTLERLLGAGTLLVVVAGACMYALGRPPENRADVFAALNADGSSEYQARLSFVWTGPVPVQESTFSSSVPHLDDRWTDGTGRLLETTVENREGGGHLTRVRYAAPAFPKERIELKETFKTAESVVGREGADFVFVDKVGLGGPPTAVSYTLTLPKGAKVVSTQPKADWSCTMNERKILRFRWTEKPGQHPEVKVKYSLPAS